VVVVPVEGRATAHLLAASLEDERRLRAELEHRDVGAEAAKAVDRLRATLGRKDAA
jgi:hypothetical protein